MDLSPSPLLDVDPGVETEDELNIVEEEAQPMSLSSFDEGEEWNKISQIIDSFGADIGQQKQLTEDDEDKDSSPDCKFIEILKRVF